MSDAVLPTGTRILRLVTPKPDFIGENGEAATYLALRPSSEDEKNVPVRVSVWDMQRTTLPQAEAFRGRSDCVPYSMFVSDVMAVGSAAKCARMRVVYDPLPEPECKRPGADGHAGIEGLDRAESTGEKKAEWKNRLTQLAKRLQRCRVDAE